MTGKRAELPGVAMPIRHPDGRPMILKMNFNFNFKDSLLAAKASIRDLTRACDFNHSAVFPI
jgi:hypothetical protein